jgi:hypothetical protein
VCVFVFRTADCKLKLLGRVFCADGQYVSGERRKLRTEELHELRNPAFSIRVMILKRARFAQYANCAGKREMCTEFYGEEERGHWKTWA